MKRTYSIVGLAALALIAAGTAPVAAQEGHWSEGCYGALTPRDYCIRVVEAVEILQPRLGMAMTGGNPVQGTASTLGLRLGTLPRIGLGLRATAVRTELPPIGEIGASQELNFFLPAIAADASVGVFSGFSLAPTLGGVGALDLLGSVALVPVPEREGFADTSPASWSVGARLGILNESFTVPGVSVSGSYRRMGDMAYGDATFEDEDAYFALTDASVLSLRAAVGKRLLMLGATAGVGWDRSSGSVDMRVSNGGAGSVLPAQRLQNEDLQTDRLTYFGNLSMTFVILHLVAEAGWQEGGESFAGALSPELLEQGSLYGGLSIRLTL
ncbi:MAG: hypothetical protein WEB88_12085 [Gemmatimonadota bacterium]